MSNRGAILLAVGMLVLGLLMGAVVGGLGGYFAGRNSAFIQPNAQTYGVQIQPGNLPPNSFTPPDRSGRRQTTTEGALITQVENNSPAAQAGLQAGDIITAVGGTKVDASHSLADLIGAKKPGDKVELSVTRGAQNLKLTVELGASAQDKNTAYLGVRYGAMSPGDGRFRQPGSQNNDLPGG